MVEGLARFADHFSGLTDQYVLIGGAACDLAMQAAARTFRVTKDLDIVLCLESLSGDFVESFWSFVRDGLYQNQEKEGGQRQYYRFVKPQTPGFPAMLELFARMPDALHFEGQGHLVPIPMTESVSSLSAILLDTDYYGWIHAGRQIQQNVSIVRPEHLIPLKAKAWLDLTDRKQSGGHVNSTDIKKHKNDIFRLLAIVDPEYSVMVPGTIAREMGTFAVRMAAEQVDLKSLGLAAVSQDEMLAQFQVLYVRR
jgi:hypothetical protein